MKVLKQMRKVLIIVLTSKERSAKILYIIIFGSFAGVACVRTEKESAFACFLVAAIFSGIAIFTNAVWPLKK